MIKIDKFIYCLIKFGKIQNFIITNKSNDIDNLRKFHNYIKMTLIIQYCSKTNAKNLLDIACGRGGDLQKWLNDRLNLKYILAFDNHSESIYSSTSKGDTFDGAIARFKNIKKHYTKKMPFINFQHLNILDTNILQKLNVIDSRKIYDIVSCQFAMHYFAKTEETLNHVLSVVSEKLKKGGMFIGTATDGDYIKNILNNGDVNIPLLTLVKQLNSNYLFYINTENENKSASKSKISNLRKNYFEVQGVSSEFYLFKETLIKLAQKNGLELVEIKSFYEWYSGDNSGGNSGGNSGYNGPEMTPYEMIISFLNFSFVFIKK